MHSTHQVDTTALRPLLSSTALAVQLALCTPPAFAGPQGGQVVAGQARIEAHGPQTTVVQSSQGAAIDWRSFNLAADERVRFVQPNAHSATLNRVTGDQASTILGRIDANGQVLLINPHGIVFGRSAQVDVGALVASTAGISNADFMAGRWVFNQPGKADARVIHQGSITVRDAGVAALVAPHVRNEGVITARLGRIALAAGDAFTLDLHGDRLIQFIVDPQALKGLTDAQGRSLHAVVEQLGTLRADGGLVALSASTSAHLLDSVIQLGGHVRATGFDTAPGLITLHGGANTQVNITGSLDVRGRTGGQILVTGGQLHLHDTAQIDASGVSGSGGTVALGGMWRGTGDLAHAQQVRIDRGARVMADGADQGHGGTISVFANGNTLVHGTLLARGGAQGGDGGAIEVSGLQRVGFDGIARAEGGTGGLAGVFLMDPRDLVIAANGGGLSDVPTDSDYTLDVNALRRVLTSGTSVALDASRDITVQAFIDGRLPEGGNAGAGLSLTAGRDVYVQQSIVLNDGAFKVQAQGRFAQSQGTVISTGLAALSIDATQGISATQLISRGAVSLTSTKGGVQVSQAIVGLDAMGKTTGVGQLMVTAATDMALNGWWSLGNVALKAGHDLTLSGTMHGDALFDAQAGNDLTLSDNSTLALTLVRQGQGRARLKAGHDLVTGDGTVVRVAQDLLMAAGRQLTLVKGTQPAEQAAAYGVQMLGDSVIELSAGGDIDILGSVRAQGGRSGTETIYAHSTNGNIRINQLTTTDAQSNRSGSALLEATQGDIVFNSALGGAGTGYDTYEKGYDRSIKPQVGALKAVARRIETNGLNLDGADALDGGPLVGLEKDGEEEKHGLWLQAKDLLIVNQKIGVNKGAVTVKVTDGMLLLGNSIYSRGWIGSGQGVAYALSVTAPRIALWDNTDEFAVTTLTTQKVKTGGPPVDPGSGDQPSDPDSGEFSDLKGAGYSVASATVGTVDTTNGTTTTTEDKVFAKITLSNNGTNFKNSTATLEALGVNSERKALITVSGLLSQVAGKGDQRIRFADQPTLTTTSLNVAGGRSVLNGKVTDNKAIGMKILALRDANDTPPEYDFYDPQGSYILTYVDINNLFFDDQGGTRDLFMTLPFNPSANASNTQGKSISGLLIKTDNDGNRLFISDTVLQSQAEETIQDSTGRYSATTNSAQVLPNNSTLTQFNDVIAGRPADNTSPEAGALPVSAALPTAGLPDARAPQTDALTGSTATPETVPPVAMLSVMNTADGADTAMEATSSAASVEDIVSLPNRPLKDSMDLGNQGAFARPANQFWVGPILGIRAPRPTLCALTETQATRACNRR